MESKQKKQQKAAVKGILKSLNIRTLIIQILIF